MDRDRGKGKKKTSEAGTAGVISRNIEGFSAKGPVRPGVPRSSQLGANCPALIGCGLNHHIVCKFVDELITFCKFVD